MCRYGWMTRSANQGTAQEQWHTSVISGRSAVPPRRYIRWVSLATHPTGQKRSNQTQTAWKQTPTRDKA